MVFYMKLALIGCGYWGKNLVREFYKANVLDTIVDLNTDFLKKFKDLYPNLNTETDYDTVLKRDDITAVCVSLPAHLHYKFAKLALDNGKDVYIEKPITLKVEHAEELVKLAKEKNRILMVGHLLHYHPCIIKIKEMVKNDKIGKILHINCNRLNLGKLRQEENVLWSFAPHDISVILGLLDNRMPKEISCFGKSSVTKNIHDVTNTIMTYADGTYVTVNVSWLNPYKEQKMSIIGTKGMICFDDTKKTGKIMYYPEHLKNEGGVLKEWKKDAEIVEYGLEQPLQLECEHFIKCCLDRTKPITDGEEGLRVLQVLTHASDSLSNNKLVVKEYFSHPTAIVSEKADIGLGSKIWHFSHVMGCSIGEKCNIGQNCFIADGVKLGKNCGLQNNVSVYNGVIAEDNVFFGPSCVLTNDKNPRREYSKNGKYVGTYIERGVSIGANATIVCGVRLGKYCLIGAGAVVTKDVEPYSIMVGNPARKIGVVDEKGDRTLF